jgi:hypothetical protein
MEAASSNGGGDGRKQGSRGKERCNNQIEATTAAGGNNSHWRQQRQRVATIVIGVQRRRWMMAFEGVGDVRWGSTEMEMVRRGGSETTARIELKSEWPMADVRWWYWRW